MMTLTERNELAGKLIDLSRTSIKEDELSASKKRDFKELYKINEIQKSVYILLEYLDELDRR